uniref:Hypoxanthine phosphoribosyltransferase n=1 Tax=Philasterides dicentrarchi TaxID=282688 RepID=A0A481SIP4_9CILI|nr:hypoxanthine phosphoribosyltransferase [Philasterides dicentrarchi]
MGNQNTTLQCKGQTFEKWISKEDIEKHITRVAEKMNEDYKDKNVLLVGVLNGAFMFLSDLSKKLKLEDCQIEFAKVVSHKGAEKGTIKELIGLKQSVKGRHVVIVDDVVHTGKTIRHIMNQLQQEEPLSIEISTLLWKKEAYEEDLSLKYVAMIVPNRFCIGYGLDIDDYARPLEDIYGLVE